MIHLGFCDCIWADVPEAVGLRSSGGISTRPQTMLLLLEGLADRFSEDE